MNAKAANSCEHRDSRAFSGIRGQKGGGTRHGIAPPIDFIEDWQILAAWGGDSHPMGGSSAEKADQEAGFPR